MSLLLCDLDDTLFDNAAAFDAWARDFAIRQDRLDELPWLASFSGSVRNESGEQAFLEAIRETFRLNGTISEVREQYYLESIRLLKCETSTIESLHQLKRLAGKLQ
jgi:FMN phosphatase YigB (HAD superfamily)